MRIQQTLILAAAMAMTACTMPQASAQNEVALRTITVTGQGEAVAAPDMAVLSIGVRTDGRTAAEALQGNSAAMTETIAKLKDLGVENRDIQTSALSINPRYDYERNRSNPPLIGYTASNSLTVKLRDLSHAGEVIDQAVSSGANSLGGISFTFADPKPLQDDARKDAVARARAKAKLLTEAAGVRLGSVLTINDGYAATPSPQPRMMRMEAASDSAVPLQAGESVISASVTIIYEIN